MAHARLRHAPFLRTLDPTHPRSATRPSDHETPTRRQSLENSSSASAAPMATVRPLEDVPT